MSCDIVDAPTSLHGYMCSMLFTCSSSPRTTLIMLSGATVTGSTMTVEGCGSDSLQGDVRFAEVMGLMGAQVQWHPYSITITGVPLHGWPSFALQICPDEFQATKSGHTSCPCPNLKSHVHGAQLQHCQNGNSQSKLCTNAPCEHAAGLVPVPGPVQGAVFCLVDHMWLCVCLQGRREISCRA